MHLFPQSPVSAWKTNQCVHFQNTFTFIFGGSAASKRKIDRRQAVETDVDHETAKASRPHCPVKMIDCQLFCRCMSFSFTFTTKIFVFGGSFTPHQHFDVHQCRIHSGLRHMTPKIKGLVRRAPSWTNKGWHQTHWLDECGQLFSQMHVISLDIQVKWLSFGALSWHIHIFLFCAEWTMHNDLHSVQLMQHIYSTFDTTKS